MTRKTTIGQTKQNLKGKTKNASQRETYRLIVSVSVKEKEKKTKNIYEMKV